MEFLDAYETPIRLSAFLGILALMATLEGLWPRRTREQTRLRRWATNMGMVVIDTLALRLVFSVLAVGVAAMATERGWGLFGLLNWPVWLEIVLSVILLDLLIYGQHVASHRIPLLWRFHRVHHTDRDFDVTTALRFHPAEIVFSMGVKFAGIVLLGAPALAVFIFEVLLNGAAMFNHANLGIPAKLDRFLRQVIVTPDMHRVHHSVVQRETDSNFGFCLSAWDRLFRTYRAQPEAPHDQMQIGLAEFQDNSPGKLWWSLWLPFHRSERHGSQLPSPEAAQPTQAE